MSSAFIIHISSLFTLCYVCYGFMEFSITVDRRPTNEEGKLNPIVFARGALDTINPYRNQSFTNKDLEGIWQNYLEYVNDTYGPEKEEQIEDLSRDIVKAFDDLPEPLGSIGDAISHGNKLHVKELAERVHHEIIPKARNLFFNPFDDTNLLIGQFSRVNISLFG